MRPRGLPGWLGVTLPALLSLLSLAYSSAGAQTPPLALTAPLTLQLLSPATAASEPARTTREFVNVLGRTSIGATVQVSGGGTDMAAAVFSTGVFVRDRVPLQLGNNRLTITATGANGQTLVHEFEVERIAVPAGTVWPTDRLFINGGSLRPAQTLRVAPGEAVPVSVHATPGQRVQARLPGQAWQALVESPLAAGQYSANLAFAADADSALPAAPVWVRVHSTNLHSTGRPSIAQPQLLTAQSAGDVGLWRADPARLLLVGAQGAELLHGLHDVRLGGPFLAELPEGTLLQASGQNGDPSSGHYRVQLAPQSSAWVAASSVAWAAAGTRPPSGVMTTLAVRGSAQGDTISLPLPRGMPYAVQALGTPDGQHYLEVDVWGGHHATTWISQRASARLVREVTVQQVGAEHIRVRVSLHHSRLWGWRTERSANALLITLRSAPVLPHAGSPLAGLLVALEPGHGSTDNLGAVGATGVPEKDINRWAAEALSAELQAAGATVLLVRAGDDNPLLRERAQRAVDAGAQLYISLHGNSADTSAGYLRAKGVSTYYKHATGHDLAAAVQKRLLEQTGLDDFGLVGNFNYTPIRRNTWMPAILVEQAFLSHPGDEAQLLDPAFRALTARAIRQGIEDFLGATIGVKTGVR